MNYIYDIVLNFQDNYYNFFEWKNGDVIRNIPKISLYKVSDSDILILRDSILKVSQDFIDKIKNDNKKYKKIICLVSNGKITLGLLFAKDGTLRKRSSLIFEEEKEANDYALKLPLTKIEYLEINKQSYQNKLRVEKEKKDILINYLQKTTDIMTLKYLYYEYFEEEEDNIEKIKELLLKELSKDWNIKQNNIYNIISMIGSVK